MATISFNITFNAISKKITVSKSTTIQQLISQSLEKFHKDPSIHKGELSYNGKSLEPSLPIRLTNLINNAKLVLKAEKVDDISQQVNVKLVVSKEGEASTTVIQKVESKSNLEQLLKQFETSSGLDLLSKPSELIILNLPYQWTKYESVVLGAVVGNISNLVIRLNFINENAEAAKLKQQEQQEAIKLQLKQQRERNARQKEEEEQARALREQERKKEAAENLQQTENESKDVAVPQKDEDVEMSSPEVNAKQERSVNSVDQTASESEEKEQYEYQTPQVPETPQLYVPDSSSKGSQPQYENPDEDYDMTVSQAQTYQKIIQNSGKRRKPKAAPKPTKYLIRLKFPDRSILQINFVKDVETIKLGQLVKKIDTLLISDYINNYNIKVGYPPQKVELTFDNNNRFLVDLPEFQSERIVLIWELGGNAGSKRGPFLNSQLIDDIKSSAELPELVLESHRGELPSEEAAKKTPATTEKHQEKGDKGTMKLPSWLKFK
ncbi:GLUT4 regulating protein TUG-domain-containing protein [Scheffersomyces xylosifermentans]|uniref:GLUT4 regulating protein TUG-domain-containing protein n=1 Tax=Scheffersomyces xylosifermentans TaxID=1304137 RepID=UPI00315D3AA1